MRPLTYLATFTLALAFWAGLVMGTTFVVDPLQFFRAADYRPLWSREQRHQAAALARRAGFDAVITGTSAMGTLRPSAASDALGMRTVHLGLNGSTIFEQRRVLELALSQGGLRAVVWGVSDFALTWPGPADAVRSDLAPDPAYLYSANPLSWARYLFDLTAFRDSLMILGTRWFGFPGYPAIDPDSLALPPASWTFSSASLRSHVDTVAAACPGRRSAVPPSAFRYAPQPLPREIEQRLRWIRELAASHQQTRFHIVLPPAHLAYYRVGTSLAPGLLCGADRLASVHVVARLAEHLVGLPNVTLHDFRTAPASFDAAGFYDPVHFSPQAAQRLIADVASGVRSIAPEAMPRATEALLLAIRADVCQRAEGVTCGEGASARATTP